MVFWICSQNRAGWKSWTKRWHCDWWVCFPDQYIVFFLPNNNGSLSTCQHSFFSIWSLYFQLCTWRSCNIIKLAIYSNPLDLVPYIWFMHVFHINSFRRNLENFLVNFIFLMKILIIYFFVNLVPRIMKKITSWTRSHYCLSTLL